jgi:predicted metal-dependent hydrolase
MTPDYSVHFGEHIYPYVIVRTERTTVGIVVDPTGEVFVKAPLKMEDTEIMKVVESKRQWIANKVKMTEKVQAPIPKRQEPVSGEKLLFKNHLYRLQIHTGREFSPKLTPVARSIHVYLSDNLTPEQRADAVKDMLIAWYRTKAGVYLQRRVQHYVKFLTTKPTGVEIRELQMRWGSCTPEGKLLFNWRILMAPISAIDYVVVHELSHLASPDHSANFWTTVESLFPTYRKWKEWLHIHGRQLDLRW